MTGVRWLKSDSPGESSLWTATCSKTAALHLNSGSLLHHRRTEILKKHLASEEAKE